jgi:hypothetical protein
MQTLEKAQPGVAATAMRGVMVAQGQQQQQVVLTRMTKKE